MSRYHGLRHKHWEILSRHFIRSLRGRNTLRVPKRKEQTLIISSSFSLPSSTVYTYSQHTQVIPSLFPSQPYPAIMQGWWCTERLSNGYDFRREFCGQGSRSDLKYTYFIDPIKDIQIAICVEQCPNTTGSPIFLYEKVEINKTKVIQQLPQFSYSTLRSKKYAKYCYPFQP